MDEDQAPSDLLCIRAPRSLPSCSQGRDWIRHSYKQKPRIIDDEEGYVPPRLPRWIPGHDDIDETNNLFNRWVVWWEELRVRRRLWTKYAR